MKNYELTCLISPDLSEEELKSFREKINSFIQEEGGTLTEINSPIKKRLAGPIKHRNQAYLTTLNFQLEPEKLANLDYNPPTTQKRLENIEKKLKSENQILRYLILIKPRPKEILVRGKKLPTPKPRKILKPKVELREIEKKLEEILGET